MATNVYCSSVAWAAVPQFAISTAYSLGQYVRQLATPAFGNERVFKVTTAGTSAGSEPSWGLTNNATTTSGSVTFTNITGQEAEQAAGNWKAPFACVAAAQTGVTAGFGVVVFVSDDHAETTSAAYDITPGNAAPLISCKRNGATLPPTATDYSAGASVTTTGAHNLRLNGFAAKGITFNCGTGSGGVNFTLGVGTNGFMWLEDCKVNIVDTNNGSTFIITSNATFPGGCRAVNTSFGFGATGQFIYLSSAANFEWAGPSGTAAITGTVPTTLFNWNSNTPPRATIIKNLDLSALNTNLFSANSIYSQFEMYDCKLHASLTITTRDCVDPLCYMKIENCDDSTSGTNYRFDHILFCVRVRASALAAAASGASDGVTPLSHRYTPGTSGGGNAVPMRPSDGPWYHKRYNTTGASKTVTVEAIAFYATQPTNLELYMETESLNTSGVPLATRISTRQDWPAGTGGSNTTSSKDWTAGAVAARANSHAYVVGDLIKVASNPNRLFRCSTAATSNGSEPGGYATAVDGGTVNDGGCVFQAGWRLKFQTTFTPQVKGVIRARISHTLSAGNAAEFFVDPLMTIT